MGVAGGNPNFCRGEAGPASPYSGRMQTAEPSELGGLPAARLHELRDLLGAAEVVRWCANLLTRRVAYDDPDLPSLTWLGGAHAADELRRGRLVERGVDYWPRVWAARGLLHVWDPAVATSAVVPALLASFTDGAWRVREMAAKVARRREVGEAADALAVLLGDATARVRLAAVRALGAVGEFEHASALRSALEDGDPSVRRAAREALGELESRLDRSIQED